MSNQEMIDLAKSILNPRKLSRSCEGGAVAAVLITDKGNVYKGVNIDTPCGMGFCAEHAAIAAMVTGGENKIAKIVAVGESGQLMPPCGRCRELMNEIHDENYDNTVVILNGGECPLKDLLPNRCM